MNVEAFTTTVGAHAKHEYFLVGDDGYYIMVQLDDARSAFAHLTKAGVSEAITAAQWNNLGTSTKPEEVVTWYGNALKLLELFDDSYPRHADGSRQETKKSMASFVEHFKQWLEDTLAEKGEQT